MLVEEVLLAARVATEAELLEEGLPRAVQLNPPVLKVIASQPVVLVFASLNMLKLPSSPGPLAGHANQFASPSWSKLLLSASEKRVAPLTPAVQ